MAAINFDDYGDHEHGGTLAAALNWAGAFLSIVLIAGLATWGWKLWVRDVTGIPVVRALEGPMRVAPEDPGGVASEYQGLTVNRIAEERAQTVPSEQVVLAPQPATLDESEDLAMADLPAVPQDDAVVTTSIDGGVEAAETTTAPLARDTSTVIAALDADAAPIVADEDPVVATDATPEPSATDLAVAAALADLGLKADEPTTKVEAAAHVPVVTPRPLMRPVNLQPVSYNPPAANGEIDAAAIPAGTRLVQLGAYASQDVARIEWSNTETRFADYMVGKERVLQEASTGGRTFYRLRAMGFDDLADARRFCAVLVADGVNCIPVVHD